MSSGLAFDLYSSLRAYRILNCWLRSVSLQPTQICLSNFLLDSCLGNLPLPSSPLSIRVIRTLTGEHCATLKCVCTTNFALITRKLSLSHKGWRAHKRSKTPFDLWWFGNLAWHARPWHDTLDTDTKRMTSKSDVYDPRTDEFTVFSVV